jgi:hypothetical protein
MGKKITWEEFYSKVASNNFAFKLDNGYPLCYFIEEEVITFFHSTEKSEFEFVAEKSSNESIVVVDNRITIDTTDGDVYVFVFSLIPFKI